jgi:hypothetical protein
MSAGNRVPTTASAHVPLQAMRNVFIHRRNRHESKELTYELIEPLVCINDTILLGAVALTYGQTQTSVTVLTGTKLKANGWPKIGGDYQPDFCKNAHRTSWH